MSTVYHKRLLAILSQLTVSLPIMMSTNGITCIIGSLKYSIRNGALRFMQTVLLWLHAWLATSSMVSGLTVRKNPCNQLGNA